MLIVLHSTSPIRAWLKFRRSGPRAKRQYSLAFGLQKLDELVDTHELVFFLWQCSHCGSPMDEVADLEAERLRLSGEGEATVDVFSGTLAKSQVLAVSGLRGDLYVGDRGL